MVKLYGDSSSDIYASFLPVVLPFIDGPCYMWFADREGKATFCAVVDSGYEIHALLIWNKINATYAAMNAQYKQRHEPCLYFKPKGSTLRWAGPTDECTVLDIKRDSINELHPTQKPVELARRAISNHDATIVADWFTGAGSTIVAAQQLNRICYGMEIHPPYCAVTLQRMTDMGLKPQIVSSQKP